MDETPTVHVTYTGTEERVEIVFADGDSEQLFVTALTADVYRCEESSLLGEVGYRDSFRASRLDDGRLRFLGIEQPSQLVTQEWLLSHSLIERPEFRLILDQIMAVGGNWEQAFGGLLLIHTPATYADVFNLRIRAFQQ